MRRRQPEGVVEDELRPCLPDSTSKSTETPISRTNGLHIRLWAWLGIRDGTVKRIAWMSFALCLPLVPLYWIYRARWTRREMTLMQVLYQIWGWGRQPDGLSRLVKQDQPPKGDGEAQKAHQSVRVCCISDTHQLHDALMLPKADVLLHCGDFTNHGNLPQVQKFTAWLAKQDFPLKVVIPGNHDCIMDAPYWRHYSGDWSWGADETTAEAMRLFKEAGAHVLIDRSIAILPDAESKQRGAVLHGSPNVPTYAPWKTAFNSSPEEMETHWRSTLPFLEEDAGYSVDILATHSPPHGILDRDILGHPEGCPKLLEALQDAAKPPKYHIFGHCHSDYGVLEKPTPQLAATAFVNAASVSDFYVVGTRDPILLDVPTRDLGELPGTVQKVALRS